ncbi:MAG: hypothetical protein QF878_07095, partial [SAR202 cluster bacterium]|nr:hypothetical protein [SAR202 cluster bacterium]
MYRYSHSMGLYALLGRGFNNPVDVAFGAGDVMYVVNRVGPEVAVRMPYKRISICTRDQDYLGEFSTGGTGAGEIMWPASIAVGPDGNVYVSDWARAMCVKVYSPEGKFLRRVGTYGGRPWVGAWDPNGMLLPSSLAVDGQDRLWVAEKDLTPKRISVWNPAGEFEREFIGPGFY